MNTPEHSTRLTHKAKQLIEVSHGQSPLSDVVRILMEVYNWGILDTKFPAWGENVDVQVRSAESKDGGAGEAG